MPVDKLVVRGVSMPGFLIYGANGYTGSLIARAAAARGHQPILAGRNAEPLATLARELGLEHRIFALDSPDAVAEGIRGVGMVLHCAGPFAHTSKPMADACLRTGVHYLDITGEVGVFEALAARDQEAKAAQVMLLPGVGFDVVPSDCLAAHLKRRLPSANRLALGFQTFGSVSRGTATTMVENIARGGVVRQDGRLASCAGSMEDQSDRLRCRPDQGHHHPLGRRFDRLLQHGHPQHRGLHRSPVGSAGGGSGKQVSGVVLGLGASSRDFSSAGFGPGRPGPAMKNEPGARASSGERPRMPPVKRW